MPAITRELVAAAVTGKSSVGAGVEALETAGWTTHTYRNTITITGDDGVVFADYRPSIGGGMVGLIDAAWIIYSAEDSMRYEVPTTS